MKFSKLVAVTAAFTLTLLVGLSTATADDEIKWKQIIGIVQTNDLVGSGAGQVVGGAPWAVRRGEAEIDLEDGEIEFKVKGLVLTVGSAPEFGITGIDIGTPGGVLEVRGTLVCDVDGSVNGDSVLVDTPVVPLSAQGNAKFEGNVGPLPDACVSEPDIAFLIRVPAFGELWIAFGAVRND